MDALRSILARLSINYGLIENSLGKLTNVITSLLGSPGTISVDINESMDRLSKLMLVYALTLEDPKLGRVLDEIFKTYVEKTNLNNYVFLEDVMHIYNMFHESFTEFYKGIIDENEYKTSDKTALKLIKCIFTNNMKFLIKLSSTSKLLSRIYYKHSKELLSKLLFHTPYGEEKDQSDLNKGFIEYTQNFIDNISELYTKTIIGKNDEFSAIEDEIHKLIIKGFNEEVELIREHCYSICNNNNPYKEDSTQLFEAIDSILSALHLSEMYVALSSNLKYGELDKKFLERGALLRIRYNHPPNIDINVSYYDIIKYFYGFLILMGYLTSFCESCEALSNMSCNSPFINYYKQLLYPFVGNECIYTLLRALASSYNSNENKHDNIRLEKYLEKLDLKHPLNSNMFKFIRKSVEDIICKLSSKDESFKKVIRSSECRDTIIEFLEYMIYTLGSIMWIIINKYIIRRESGDVPIGKINAIIKNITGKQFIDIYRLLLYSSLLIMSGNPSLAPLDSIQIYELNTSRTSLEYTPKVDLIIYVRPYNTLIIAEETISQLYHKKDIVDKIEQVLSNYMLLILDVSDSQLDIYPAIITTPKTVEHVYEYLKYNYTGVSPLSIRIPNYEHELKSTQIPGYTRLLISSHLFDIYFHIELVCKANSQLTCTINKVSSLKENSKSLKSIDMNLEEVLRYLNYNLLQVVGYLSSTE